MIEKDIHAVRIAVWHNQKTAFTTNRFNGSIDISIFSDVVARYRRTYTLLAPTVFRLVDSSESGFILKH